MTAKILKTVTSILYVCVMCCICAGRTPIYAQTAHSTLTGVVEDTGGAVLKGASIKLSPSNIIAVSDEVGEFNIYNIAPGKYTITITASGFTDLTQEVTLAAGMTQKLELKLSVKSRADQVVVSASRAHGEVDAINMTRSADNLVQVLPAEVIVSLPNANAADAIGRLPSVTLYRIEGEGVYIQVRGTEPRLTNVTVDGITIPAPEPTVRQVRLDVIPSDMIESVEINKTLSANMDGNGIGGSANIRTKEAGERPTIAAYGNGGYTNILNGRNEFGYGGTVGKRFGPNHKFGILGDGSYDFNGRGIDNFQPTLDPLSTYAQPFYDGNTIREYRYYRTRYGYDGSADYKFNENNSVFMHGFYTDLKDWGDKWYYSPQSTAITCNSSTPGACNNGANETLPSASAASPSPKFYTSSKRPNASVGTLILGGRHTFAHDQIFWELSASRSYEVDSAGNPKADFGWLGPSEYCNYIPSSNTDIYHPHFGTCDTSNTSPLLTPGNWYFKDITISKGINAQLNLTGQGSFSHYYTTKGGHFGTLEVGFKFSNGHQSQDSTETVYDSWSKTTAPTISSLESNFNNTDYFNGKFFGGQFGPVSDFNQVAAYTLANYGSYVDGQKTAADIYPNLFHTVEQVISGYVMNTADFGKLHVQTGLRIEGTRMMTFGYNLTYYGTYNSGTNKWSGGTSSVDCAGNTAPVAPAGNCYVFTGVNNNPGYVDFLPSVQARYALTPNSNIRAVYARGMARPDPYQLVPYATEDTTASPVAVTIGNPLLRPEHANNFDVLYENYLQPVGMFQAGVFFKQLNAPQVPITLPGGLNLSSFPTGYFPPAIAAVLGEYPGDAITQYVNGQNAYIWGMETGYQQHLTFLPGVLHGIGITANYSYTASREKGLPLRTDHPQTIDQSPNSWNLSPTYDLGRFSGRAGLSYNQASLFQYSYASPTYVTGADPSGLGPKGPSGDIYTYTHYQVDAQISYRLWHGLSAVVSGLNLNNEVFGYYQGVTQFVNQREYYKPTYAGGMRYNFGQGKTN